ncbi:glycosyltransferase 87 family protein [Actinocorallia longicatena]|uniref:Glycosyltransferase 87 family protein n=1 Tax=Actinocorallia longicatena TaxID=111803 RepID=A0ABP6PZ95_9ACTN
MKSTWVYRLLAFQLVSVAVFAIAWDALDFRIYALGGRVVADGTRLYTEELAAHWFTYTPFAGVAFAPLSLLPLTAARLLWELGSVAALGWACAQTARIAGWRVTPVRLAAAVSGGLLLEPVWHSLFLGQINLFLLAMVLTDVRRLREGRRAGIGIGIATAVKLTPGIFVVLLLLAGRVRDALVAAGAFLGCGVAAFLVAPEASWHYWTHVFYDTSRVGAPYISNQSPFGALLRVLGGAGSVGGWYPVVPAALGCAGIAVAALRARRGDWLAAAAVTGCTGLLVSPISWTHHWVWVIPALAVLVRDGHRIAAGAAVALFVLAPMWLTPHPRYGFHGAMTVAANAYLLAGLGFLVFMGLRARAPGRGSVPGARGVVQAVHGS